MRLSPALLSEIAVAVALASVLSLFKIKLPHLIYGGSVSLHTLPIVIVALRRGVRPGLWAGVAYGIVNFLMTPYFVHPLQLLLDYPLAFATLSLAGLARTRPAAFLCAAAAVGAGSVRLAVHVLSGIVYFGEYAPEGTPVWQYSFLYNASYMIPETLIAAVAVAVLGPRLVRSLHLES